jgi:hypothetical protein
MHPHPRTLRKAREQIKWMVHDGFSTQTIRRYLHRFALWWANTSDTWTYEALLAAFASSCWDKQLAIVAYDLLRVPTRGCGTGSLQLRQILG